MIFSHFVLFVEFWSFSRAGGYFWGKVYDFQSQFHLAKQYSFFNIRVPSESPFSFCHSKKSTKIAENAKIPNFGSNSTQLNMSESEKLFFPQLLYTIRQLKNFGFIDKSHFCFFQPYLLYTFTMGKKYIESTFMTPKSLASCSWICQTLLRHCCCHSVDRMLSDYQVLSS